MGDAWEVGEWRTEKSEEERKKKKKPEWSEGEIKHWCGNGGLDLAGKCEKELSQKVGAGLVKKKDKDSAKKPVQAMLKLKSGELWSEKLGEGRSKWNSWD